MRNLALTVLAGLATLIVVSAGAAAVETVARFNPAVFETPESIQVDRHGNVYLSMALTGEIRHLAPDGTQASLAVLPIRPDVQPCRNGFGLAIMGGLALDHQGTVYASVNSCHVPDHGIWQVSPTGQSSLLARLPAAAAPNGIAYHAGWLYVADAVLGVIWRLPADGGSLPDDTGGAYAFMGVPHIDRASRGAHHKTPSLLAH